MPIRYAEARNIVFLKSVLPGRSLFTEKKEHMSGTIKAIERHMILPVRSGRRGDMDSLHGELGLQNRERKLVGEWQQRGPETFSGYALRKLRLAFASSQSTKLATVNG
jgi:hypothetical protein